MENTTLLFNDEMENIIDAMDLSQEAPVEEPQRQYWFMKKARQLVKEQSEKLEDRLLPILRLSDAR